MCYFLLLLAVTYFRGARWPAPIENMFPPTDAGLAAGGAAAPNAGAGAANVGAAATGCAVPNGVAFGAEAPPAMFPDEPNGEFVVDGPPNGLPVPVPAAAGATAAPPPNWKMLDCAWPPVGAGAVAPDPPKLNVLCDGGCCCAVLALAAPPNVDTPEPPDCTGPAFETVALAEPAVPDPAAPNTNAPPL